MNEDTQKKRGRQIASKELSIFCHQLSVILTSDITILEGIKLLSEQSEERQVRKALADIYADMHQSGASFSEAISHQKGVFPSYFTNLITIGEQSGALDNTLLKLADYYEKESKVRRKVRTAITYPIVLAVLMVGVILLLLTKVLPLFSDILSSVGGDLPAMTKGVMNIGDFIAANFVVILVCLAVIVLLCLLLRRVKSWRYFWDSVIMHLPVAKGVLTKITTSRFARGMAIQLSAGISLNVAMELIDALVSNSYIARKFEACRKTIQSGGEFMTALGDMQIFTPLFMRMVLIGQKTGNLDIMLAKAAGLFEEEVDSALDRLVTSVEPVLIIILSLIVGVILVSVMLPMINIISNIG